MHGVDAAEGRSAVPPMVTREEWQRRDSLLVKQESAVVELSAGYAGCSVEGCE
jgi:hypothetical protein